MRLTAHGDMSHPSTTSAVAAASCPDSASACARSRYQSAARRIGRGRVVFVDRVSELLYVSAVASPPFELPWRMRAGDHALFVEAPGAGRSETVRFRVNLF